MRAYFLPSSWPILASQRPHLWSVTPRYLELPLANPVLWRRRMCTNSSLVQFLIWQKTQPPPTGYQPSDKTDIYPAHLVVQSAYSLDYLLQILLIVAQIEVDVGLQPPELDRRAIVGPATRQTVVSVQFMVKSGQKEFKSSLIN